MWRDIRAALEDIQAVANIVSKRHQQVKVNADNVGAAMAKANRANSEAAALKTQLDGMYQTQRAEEKKLTQVNVQFYQLNSAKNFGKTTWPCHVFRVQAALEWDL
jgi:hypothetical protein